MPRNIELKVRVADVDALRPRLRELSGVEPNRIDQDDLFFGAADGRLKLRRIAGGRAELIHYRRNDATAARASDYERVAVGDAEAMDRLLTRACGRIGRVVKRRWLAVVGQTRVHLDRVDGLGDFVELEVVLQAGQTDDWGAAEAERMLAALGLAAAPRVAVAYVDLLIAPRAGLRPARPPRGIKVPGKAGSP